MVEIQNEEREKINIQPLKTSIRKSVSCGKVSLCKIFTIFKVQEPLPVLKTVSNEKKKKELVPFI